MNAKRLTKAIETKTDATVTITEKSGGRLYFYAVNETTGRYADAWVAADGKLNGAPECGSHNYPGTGFRRTIKAVVSHLS